MVALKEITLPIAANPLARHIGRLMKAYRLARGWTVAQAAEDLGIVPGHYFYLEAGRILPKPKLAKRLRSWLVDKISFKGDSPISERAYRTDTEAQGWRLVKVAVPLADAKRLTQEAARLNMGVRDLVAVYIRLGLASKMAWATMAEAMHDLQELQVTQLLQEAPELRDLLLADEKIIEMVPETVPSGTVAEVRPEVEKLGRIRLEDFEQEEEL